MPFPVREPHEEHRHDGVPGYPPYAETTPAGRFLLSSHPGVYPPTNPSHNFGDITFGRPSYSGLGIGPTTPVLFPLATSPALFPQPLFPQFPQPLFPSAAQHSAPTLSYLPTGFHSISTSRDTFRPCDFCHHPGTILLSRGGAISRMKLEFPHLDLVQLGGWTNQHGVVVPFACKVTGTQLRVCEFRGVNNSPSIWLVQECIDSPPPPPTPESAEPRRGLREDFRLEVDRYVCRYRDLHGRFPAPAEIIRGITTLANEEQSLLSPTDPRLFSSKELDGTKTKVRNHVRHLRHQSSRDNGVPKNFHTLNDLRNEQNRNSFRLPLGWKPRTDFESVEHLAKELGLSPDDYFVLPIDSEAKHFLDTHCSEKLPAQHTPCNVVQQSEGEPMLTLDDVASRQKKRTPADADPDPVDADPDPTVQQAPTKLPSSPPKKPKRLGREQRRDLEETSVLCSPACLYTLLQYMLSAPSAKKALSTDGTFNFTYEGNVLIVIGILEQFFRSSQNQKKATSSLRPVVLCHAPSESKPAFVVSLFLLKRLFLQVFGMELRIDVGESDYARAFFNGYRVVFPRLRNMLCWFHVKQSLDKPSAKHNGGGTFGKLKNKSNAAVFQALLDMVHQSPTYHSARLLANTLTTTWCSLVGEVSAGTHFYKTYVTDRNFCWFYNVVGEPGITPTGSPAERFNLDVKGTSQLGGIIQKCVDRATFWSQSLKRLFRFIRYERSGYRICDTANIPLDNEMLLRVLLINESDVVATDADKAWSVARRQWVGDGDGLTPDKLSLMRKAQCGDKAPFMCSCPSCSNELSTNNNAALLRLMNRIHQWSTGCCDVKKSSRDGEDYRCNCAEYMKNLICPAVVFVRFVGKRAELLTLCTILRGKKSGTRPRTTGLSGNKPGIRKEKRSAVPTELTEAAIQLINNVLTRKQLGRVGLTMGIPSPTNGVTTGEQMEWWRHRLVKVALGNREHNGEGCIGNCLKCVHAVADQFMSPSLSRALMKRTASSIRREGKKTRPKGSETPRGAKILSQHRSRNRHAHKGKDTSSTTVGMPQLLAKRR